FLPVCVYLPTHLLLSKLLPRRFRSSTMRALSFLLVTVAVTLLVPPFAAAAPDAPKPSVVDRDLDSGGDGLADFQELHKYNTDPLLQLQCPHTEGQPRDSPGPGGGV